MAEEEFAARVFAAEHVVYGEAVEVDALQRLDRFAKDDVFDTAISVEQGEMTIGFLFQRGFDDGTQGRDPAAGCKGHVVVLVNRVEFGVEITEGSHHVQAIARLQVCVGEGREPAALDAFDRHAQLAAVRARADRIRAAHLFAPEFGL